MAKYEARVLEDFDAIFAEEDAIKQSAGRALSSRELDFVENELAQKALVEVLHHEENVQTITCVLPIRQVGLIAEFSPMIGSTISEEVAELALSAALSGDVHFERSVKFYSADGTTNPLIRSVYLRAGFRETHSGGNLIRERTVHRAA